jgi:hypothetical protein
MQKRVFLIICILLSAITLAGSPEEDFKNPPQQAGIRCWWWWLNSNITAEAITRDLEAMHDKNFSGALIFDAGGAEQRGNRQVPAGPTFASPEWVGLFKHAVSEADRLGLELGLCIQSGWNLGGPTVTPEIAAKRLTWSDIEIKGPLAASKVLPEPPTREGFYRDIAVLAYPIRDSDAGISVTARSSQPEFVPQNAIDQKPDTIWVSGGTRPGQGPTEKNPEWLNVAFENPTQITGMRLTGRPKYGPRKGHLQVLAGDNEYRTIQSFDMTDGQAYEASFKPVTGKAFRLVIVDSYDPVHPTSVRNVQIAEFALLDADGRNLFERPDRRPIRDLNLKASFQELGMSAPDARFLLDDVPPREGEEDATVDQIINLTDKLARGRLTWNVPEGRWCVLRFGYTCNDTRVSTHSQGWGGLVIDYLSTESITHYLNDVVEPLLKAAGPAAGTTLKYLQTDSWECGGMNWTDKFPAEFKHRRGYDPIPYLPVIAGKIVNSRTASNRFLADFRKTISDCIAENHYQTFADFAHRHNMGIQPESGGPHAGPFDGIKNLGRNDIAMSEFWSPSGHRPTPPERFFVKQASAAAHIYGRKLIGAESFTTIGRHWNDVLWSQTKPAFDHEACSGLNLVYLHTFTCSPKEMGLPGQEYFAGTHFNPQVTWWEYADGIIDYIRRIQYIVQQGKFEADVLYYYGDHVPNIARLKEDDPAQVLPTYDYDITDEEILLQLKVTNGRIVVPGGVRYRLLVLPDHKVLSLAALEKVDELLKQGASVLGPKPERLVSLVGGQQAQIKFQMLADAVWGDTPETEGGRKVGSGTVYWGKTGRQVLEEMDILPDFETSDKQPGVFDYIHYTLGDKDVYFVCNLTEDALETVGRFRVTGKTPQLWNPLNGEIQETIAFTQSDGRTAVPMRFGSYGTWLVIFQNEAPKTTVSDVVNYKDFVPVQTLAGPWQVTFEPKWGGPGTVTFTTLTNWVEHAIRGIKFYSGKAVYETTFDMDALDAGKEYQLDLGDVQDVGICRVVLNGEDLGIVWTKPFRCCLTGVLKRGENRLQVSVINSWRNRLIGDENLPADQRYTQTNIVVRRDWRPEESGLLGPVQVLCER